MDLVQFGYCLEYWKFEDLVLVFVLFNFGLVVNLQEEIVLLMFVQKVGSDKLVWLMLIYFDENLLFDEVEKFKGLCLDGQVFGFVGVEGVVWQVVVLSMFGVVVLNNWVIVL